MVGMRMVDEVRDMRYMIRSVDYGHDNYDTAFWTRTRTPTRAEAIIYEAYPPIPRF